MIVRRIEFLINGLFVSTTVFAFITALFTLALIEGQKSKRAAEFSRDQHVTSTLIEIAALTKQIEVDIVQVQQFLTDISATRGEDHLEEGFEDAARYASAFTRDTAHAKEIAASLGDEKLRRVYEEEEKAFPAYYSVGVTMAKTYVERGTAAGNELMPQFDEVALALADKNAQSQVLLAALLRNEDARNRDIEQTLISGEERIVAVCMGSALMIFLLSVTVGYISHIRLFRPLYAITLYLKRLADCDYQRAVPFAKRRDEIGSIAQSIEQLEENLVERATLQAEKDLARQAEDLRRHKLEALIRDFRAKSHNTLGIVTSESDAMASAADQLAVLASQGRQEAEQALMAIESSSSNVGAVANASAELNSSIGEVNLQISRTRDVVNNATSAAHRTSDAIEILSGKASEIAEIVGLIQMIAEHTNVLALNATIEAARAGGAGAGFSVVAQEVKQLANQTAKASERVATHVSAIQTLTDDVVFSIGAIVATMTEAETAASIIADAAQHQSNATHNIAHSVADAANSVDIMVSNMTRLGCVVTQTDRSATEVHQASENVAAHSRDLSVTFDQFLLKIASV